MRLSDLGATIVTTIFGAITGLLVGGVPAAAILGVVGVLFGALAARSNVRPSIAMTSFVGAMAGVLVGSSIVETICLPATCPGYEIAGAVVIGVGAFVGVGLLAALVTRSFDEYNEKVDAGEPPPTVGCETEPRVDDSDS